VAYDLDYSNTQSTDFTNLSQEIVDSFDEIVFLGAKRLQKKILQLASEESFSEKEAKLLFGRGYLAFIPHISYRRAVT